MDEHQLKEIYKITNSEELEFFKRLHDDRELLDHKIVSGLATKEEVLNKIKHEIEMLEWYQKKNDRKNAKLINSKVLDIFINYIVDMYCNLLLLFPVDVDLVSEYMEFSFIHTKNSEYHNTKIRLMLESVKGVKNNPNLWIKLLKNYMSRGCFDQVLDIFYTGIMILKDNSMSLWDLIIEYVFDIYPIHAEKLYKHGVELTYEDITAELKSEYLKWCVHHKGIDATRVLFNELESLEPECQQLYTSMIVVEKQQNASNYSVDTIRNLYVKACVKFGEKNVGIWADHIMFEYSHGCPSLVEVIYESALIYLNPHFMDAMTKTFDQLKEEFK